MNLHFIAIGGSVMSQLAICLHLTGHSVNGSDDEIFNPSRANLEKHNLLPESEGWDPERIHSGLDAIILGMHAKADNPELLRATELKIPTYSFPEYIYEQSKSQKRIVIAGSHGKTSTTAMVMHVLKMLNYPFNYLVGASLEGFERQVELNPEHELILIEGDEYLASSLLPYPKFHYYKPHITSISGIAWDHINVFPTEENYIDQFRIYLDKVEPSGNVIYYKEDSHLESIISEFPNEHGLNLVPYSSPTYSISEGKFIVKHESEEGIKEYALSIFGRHNMENLEAARLICECLSKDPELDINIDADTFYTAMQRFKGAARRLQLYRESKQRAFYWDFAHAPSKVRASTAAVKELYPERKLITILELHTYSSLNKEFLSEYKDALSASDRAIVYFNAHTLKIKGLADLDSEYVKAAFGHHDLQVLIDKKELLSEIKAIGTDDHHWLSLLIMTSGNLSGIELDDIATFVLGE